jgi:hypothetical protein
VIFYSMSLSADGYIAGPDGSFDWAVPSQELHRFHNERVAVIDAQLLGRRLYETMLVWGAEEFADPVMAEFAEIWRPLEKIVFSTTLTSVEGSNRLATGTLEEEIAALGDRRIAVGGRIGVRARPAGATNGATCPTDPSRAQPFSISRKPLEPCPT